MSPDFTVPDAVTAPVLAVDADGVVRGANAAFVSAGAGTLDNVLAKPFAALCDASVPEAEASLRALSQALRNRTPLDGVKLVLRDGNGAAWPVSLSARPLGHVTWLTLLDRRESLRADRLEDLLNMAQQFGRLDFAVNNAGIAGVLTPMTDYPLDTWHRVLAVNLSGVFHCLRAEIPVMLRQGGGAIVNMASILGTVAFPGAAAYVAAKHGVIGLTRTAALEYGPANIRVNAVCPSFIQTPLTLGPIPAGETWDTLAALHALKRCAQPEEIAAAVAFLGSDDASFVSGSAQIVDGAFTAA